MEAEIPEWDFNGVRSAARESWNNYLAKIDIETSDKDQSASDVLYCTPIIPVCKPNLFTNADGRYHGYGFETSSGQCGRACLYRILFMGHSGHIIR